MLRSSSLEQLSSAPSHQVSSVPAPDLSRRYVTACFLPQQLLQLEDLYDLLRGLLDYYDAADLFPHFHLNKASLADFVCKLDQLKTAIDNFSSSKLQSGRIYISGSFKEYDHIKTLFQNSIKILDDLTSPFPSTIPVLKKIDGLGAALLDVAKSDKDQELVKIVTEACFNVESLQLLELEQLSGLEILMNNLQKEMKDAYLLGCLSEAYLKFQDLHEVFFAVRPLVLSVLFRKVYENFVEISKLEIVSDTFVSKSAQGYQYETPFVGQTVKIGEQFFQCSEDKPLDISTPVSGSNSVNPQN